MLVGSACPADGTVIRSAVAAADKRTSVRAGRNPLCDANWCGTPSSSHRRPGELTGSGGEDRPYGALRTDVAPIHPWGSTGSPAPLAAGCDLAARSRIRRDVRPIPGGMSFHRGRLARKHIGDQVRGASIKAVRFATV